jgi:signal transduction histidine kinase
VIDNGVGISDTATGGRGLANVAERAHALGGSCNVSPTEDGGTLVDWRIPLSLAD